MASAPRVLVIGAHPDDCELQAAGTALRYRQIGAAVKFVSATDGRSGHFEGPPAAVAKRRAREAKAACALAGIDSEVLDIPSNGIEADLATRERFLRLIRDFNPDVIITHRGNDYHPDHRRTALLVQDSAYAVRVPLVCPDSPAMAASPLILLMHDEFTQPSPFRPDVLVDIGAQMDMKVRMLDCHASQVYEWLPYMDGVLESVPPEAGERLGWLTAREEARNHRVAERFRAQLEAAGGSAGLAVRFAEAFEASEYGARLTPEARERLIPFALQ